MKNDLINFRKKIDSIDKKITALLGKRAEIVCKLSLIKKNNRLPILDEDREKKLIDNLKLLSSKPLTNKRLERVYKTILQVMKETMDDC